MLSLTKAFLGIPEVAKEIEEGNYKALTERLINEPYEGVFGELYFIFLENGVDLAAYTNTIPEAAFGYNRDIATIDIEKNFAGITTIDQWAFTQSDIEIANIPNTVTNAARGCFWNCRCLRSVKVPGSIKVIPEDMFGDCEMLRKIVIEEGVGQIQKAALAGTSRLDIISIPKSVTIIESGVFDDSNLHHIQYGGTKEDWKKIKFLGADTSEYGLFGDIGGRYVTVICTDGELEVNNYGE